MKKHEHGQSYTFLTPPPPSLIQRHIYLFLIIIFHVIDTDKGSPLAELHLANNEIGPEGCEYLAQALEENKYLKVLVLNHNPIEDDVSTSVYI